LWISEASRRDWPYFARWHYRSHELALTRFHTLLWHGDEPIGICIFSTPPLSLAGRNRFFGLRGRWNRLRLKMLNRQIAMLSRVVLHPTYRGAGIAAEFVRRSCQLCPFPWIETLTEMGRINPFFERAGFVRVPTGATKSEKMQSRRGHSSIYGGRRKDGSRILVSQETYEKSRFARPVYYIFDNRDGRRTRQI
jgi:GNAT superfamily N-acetyltransferase